MADAGIVQDAPGKLFAGILLARRRDVGMAEHARRRNRVAGEDAAAQRSHRRDLPLGKIAIAELMAGIGDLDTDRAGIDVGLAGP